MAGADIVITTYATAVRDVEGLSNMKWDRIVIDEAQAIKNPASETAQQLRRLEARNKVALTGTPIENGLGDLWSILDFANPGIVGSRPAFIAQLSGDGEKALRALNGVLVFRRTKAEPFVARELPDHIDELDHCTLTPEQIGLYQAVLDELVVTASGGNTQAKKRAVLAAITKLKQICNHPAAYVADDQPLAGRSKSNRNCPSSFSTVGLGRNGTKSFFTPTGPAPGPPPPWGVVKVLCRFRCTASKPMSPGLQMPISAFRLAPS